MHTHLGVLDLKGLGQKRTRCFGTTPNFIEVGPIDSHTTSVSAICNIKHGAANTVHCG